MGLCPSFRCILCWGGAYLDPKKGGITVSLGQSPICTGSLRMFEGSGTCNSSHSPFLQVQWTKTWRPADPMACYGQQASRAGRRSCRAGLWWSKPSWIPFWSSRCTTHFRREWDVDWGYGILTYTFFFGFDARQKGRDHFGRGYFPFVVCRYLLFRGFMANKKDRPISGLFANTSLAVQRRKQRKQLTNATARCPSVGRSRCREAGCIV